MSDNRNPSAKANHDQPTHDIIVIGASAGGVEALSVLVSQLPASFEGSLFVVLHIPADGPSLLPAILSRAGVLKAHHPHDGEKISKGKIYVAPPDKHLLVENGYVRVVHGPKENRNRPAIDPLMRTAARAYGPRVVGVILTGSLDDGTAGLLAIKRVGGQAIVQDPAEALYASMPRSAVENVEVDAVLPLDAIAKRLIELIHEPIPVIKDWSVSPELEKEAKMAEFDLGAIEAEYPDATPSAFSCPECGGVLWELQDGELTRFRCRVGHAFSVESMLAEQSDALERAMWTALKTLEENVSFSRRLAHQANERGQDWLAKRYNERVSEGEEQSRLLREVLLHNIPHLKPDAQQYNEGVDNN